MGFANVRAGTLKRRGGYQDKYSNTLLYCACRYFNSSMATLIMQSLKREFLWVHDVASSATKTGAFKAALPTRVQKLNESLDSVWLGG